MHSNALNRATGGGAAANAQEGRAYPLTGPEALTPRERTRILADVFGRDLTFVQLAESEERERLRSHGNGDEYVEFGIQLATNPRTVLVL